jgi:hypothetical protein
MLESGEPFPTALWLTCPWLAARVGLDESDGIAAQWTRRVAGDSALADAVIEADARYRGLRARLAGGRDPCGDVGVAGQSDPLVVKCLHARVAAELAGVGDPVGAGELTRLGEHGRVECPDGLCGAGGAGGDG